MPHRLRTLARAALLLAAVMLVALALALAVVRLPPVQRWVAAAVSERLPAGVQIERAAITLLPPGVQLSNVSVGANTPTFTSVSCRLRVAELLAGRVELETVVIDGATLVIERDADGDIELSGALAALMPVGSGSAAPHAVVPAIVLADLPAVTVNHASATFIDHVGHAGPHTLQLTAVRLTLDHIASGSMPFTLAAQFEPAGQVSAHGSVQQTSGGAERAIDVALTASQVDADTIVSYLSAVVPGGGTATAQGDLDLTLTLSSSAAGVTGDAALSQSVGAIVWDEVHLAAPVQVAAHIDAAPNRLALSAGRLQIAQLAAARIDASALTADFTYADGTLHLASVHARAYDGSWTQQGTVTIAEPPSYDISLRAEDVGCQALLMAVTGERPNYGCERLSAEAAVHGQWTGAESVAQGAVGRGRVEMRGGTIPSSSIIGAVWHAMVPLVSVGREPRSIGAPTEVDHLRDSFELRNGRMFTSNLSLVTDDYTVTGSGSIGLEGTLNLNTEIALTAAGVTKLLLMAALPIPGTLPTLPAIPTSITGTVGSPSIRPDAEDLPLAAARSLFAGARGAGEVLKDTAGKGLRGLEHGLEQIW